MATGSDKDLINGAETGQGDHQDGAIARVGTPLQPAQFEERVRPRAASDGYLGTIDPEAVVSEALLYAKDAKGIAPLSYADDFESQIRNFPITPNLEWKIRRAVYEVYGPGYSIVIGSGGQPEAGTVLEAINTRRDPYWTPKKQKLNPKDTEFKGRVGTHRHDRGHAADFNVIGPNGEVIHGEELAKLGQYWAAKELGGLGLEMDKHRIHLDEKKRANWKYDTYTPAMARRIRAGMAGELPELYQPPVMPAPTLSASELGIEDPLESSRHARLYGNFNDADPRWMAQQAYEYTKSMPPDPYREPEIPVPVRRPARRPQP